jgi:hypothetical protein
MRSRFPPFADCAKDGAPTCIGHAGKIKSLGHPARRKQEADSSRDKAALGMTNFKRDKAALGMTNFKRDNAALGMQTQEG